MKKYKRLKRGQLCTIGNHIYRATNTPYDGLGTCTHCRRTNESKLPCKRQDGKRDLKGIMKCNILFGRNYPKLVK